MSASTLHRPTDLVPPARRSRPGPGGGSARIAPAGTPTGTGGPAAPRRSFSVGRKLGCLAGLGALTTLFVTGVTLSGLGTVSRLQEELQVLESAKTGLMQLDTRSSELKVDGYKAAVRADPAGEAAELSDDIAAGTALVDRLQALSLPSALADRVDVVAQAYDTYAAGISAYVDSTAKDQEAGRAAYADIQATNDGMDEVLSATLEQVSAEDSAAEQELHRASSRVKQLTAATAVLGLIALGAIALAITRSIVRPLRRVSGVLSALAAGDLTARAQVDSGDELGEMALALGAAQESLRGTVSALSANASALAAASEEMSATAGSIAASAEETSAQSGVVSAAAEMVSRNVQTVATGADEMGASIREISQNANEAARVGSSAVGVAEATNATVTRLGDSSRQIGDVVKTITSIAEQTNLLALNATIEAARAGEAGKGFAVVANEVKDLAQETAKATEDIGRRVEAIQADTAGAVTAIAEISGVIARMNDFQTTIASAVEEQTATTNEMSRNVAQAAHGSTEIAENIVAVATAAQVTSSGVQDTRQAADELARMSNELQTLVDNFRY